MIKINSQSHQTRHYSNLYISIKKSSLHSQIKNVPLFLEQLALEKVEIGNCKYLLHVEPSQRMNIERLMPQTPKVRKVMMSS